MQGLHTNIHCLALELSEWISSFVKPLKVILTKRFVKQNLNFKRKYEDEQFKYKIIFADCVVNIRGQMLSFCYIAFPLLAIVRTICLFVNFEKLSILLGFSRDIVEGWARVCCVHVFLV